FDALSPPLVNGVNRGFLRDGAYLAIIPVTDAEDQSAHNNELSLYNFLLSLKNGEAYKLLGYGAIIPTNTAFPNCSRDDGTTPKRIEAFLSMLSTAPHNVMELCAPDFGAQLGMLGKNLVDRISRVIVLKRAPVLDSIVVRYGTQIIPRDAEAGWSFDSIK